MPKHDLQRNYIYLVKQSTHIMATLKMKDSQNRKR